MKKTLSILFSLLIMLSAMQFSFATHICCGKLAAVKVSLSGEAANCGMEDGKQTAGTTVSSTCCHNKIAVCKTDKNYNPTTLHINEISKKLIYVATIPATIDLGLNSIQVSNLSDVSPPSNYNTSAVSLHSICVYRI